MAIKRKDFQKLSSTVQEFLLKLPDEESSSRLRDNLLHALHFLQLYYRVLQNRDKNNDPLQWNIDHSLSPLTPFKEAPDKFEWEWINVDSQKLRNSLQRSTLTQSTSLDNYKVLPQIITSIKEGDLAAIKQMVKQEPDAVNVTDSFTRDCLTYAIQFDKYDILKYLLMNGANAKNTASDSSTCLHRAVYKNSVEMVELLLESKANINAQDSYNRAPLHWSVVYAGVDCLKALLKYNPNKSIKDKDGMTPSMWACHLDRLEHFKLLNSKLDSNKNNLVKSIESEADNDGRTWIHWSVRKNEPLECLNFLINCETALIRDKDGKTCLHVAAEQGAVQACKSIIDVAGQKILSEMDNKKQTPLHLATLNGHARAIKILLDYGADPNFKDVTGASAIDYVNKRNLFFCNSIIEICLRNNERKNNRQLSGAGSSNSIASSFNGSETNLTPAPPTTPKTNFSRSFQQIVPKDISGRPPRPTAINDSLNASQNGELSKTAPASLNASNSLQYSMAPPVPPPGAKTRPNLNHRGGWTSAERVMSGSLRLSRASTRTSLASDDLDKYMTSTTAMDMNFGGSLNNIDQPLQQQQQQQLSLNPVKPLPPPRLNSSGSASNMNMNKLFGARSQDTVMSTVSFEMPSNNNPLPPPVKPRKSSSVASLNTINSNNSNNNNNNYIALNENIKKVNHSNNNNLNVEDMSEDEQLSLASVKGEGFASDLSDSEMRSQQMHRAKMKKQPIGQQDQNQSIKRPTTPMDFRIVEQNQQKAKQESSSNKSNVNANVNSGGAVVHQRFNEWDPYANLRNNADRQKSPLKSKNQASSNFAQSFFSTTDSSPRQTSGRNAGVQYPTQMNQKMSPQHQLSQQATSQQQQQAINNKNIIEIDLNSSANNLDLIISGQKLGGSRKDLSPTNINNTPRDSSNQTGGGALLQQQQKQDRPFTRRLQPLDKMASNSNMDALVKDNTNQDSQFLSRLKTSKTVLDRKKLEPIKNPNHANLNYNQIMNMNNSSHVEFSLSTGHSINENDNTLSHTNFINNNNNIVLNNEEELSISENTLSSDKHVNSNSTNTTTNNNNNNNNNMRISKKKILKFF